MIVGSAAVMFVLPPFRLAYCTWLSKSSIPEGSLLGASESHRMTAATMIRRREFGFDSLGYLRWRNRPRRAKWAPGWASG